MSFRISAMCTPLKDSNSENLIFMTKYQREIYFHLSQVRNGAPCNFNIKNGIDSECYVDTDLYENNNNYYQQILGIGSPLHCNYCVIYDDDTGLPEWDQYRFYFINKIEHDTQRRQYKLYLHLDSFQTYYPYLKFEDCFVERAHIDRYYSIGNVNYPNFTVNSFLLKDEKINVNNSFILKKSKVKPQQAINRYNDNLQQWLLNNILYYKYYFIKYSNLDNVALTFIDSYGCILSSANKLKRLKYTNMESDIVCICVPIYKADKQIGFISPSVSNSSQNNTIYFSDIEINRFINSNNLSSNIISVKLSLLSPFCLSDILATNHYTINIDGNLILYDYNYRYNDSLFENDTLICSFIYGQGIGPIGNYPAFINISNTEPLDELRLYFERDGSIWSNIPENYIPVLSNNSVKESYHRTKEIIYEYSIVLQFMNTRTTINPASILSVFNDELYFRYYETLIPDISRSIIDIVVPEYALMRESEKTMHFMTCSCDQFLLFSKEAYDEFIVNNKNFYNAFKTRSENQILKSGINSIIGVASGVANLAAFGGPATELSSVTGGLQVTKSGVSFINNIIDINNDKEMLNYSIDNLKNAPPTIENIEGNIYLNANYNDLVGYFIIEKTIEGDMQQIEFYFRKYGYSISKFANIKSTEIQPRKYFNYVKANVDNVFIDNKDMWDNQQSYYGQPFLSNELINDIKRIFKNGIAIWKVAEIIPTFEGVEFDYTINNYEERFDNE